jgi:hypothetical protein
MRSVVILHHRRISVVEVDDAMGEEVFLVVEMNLFRRDAYR